MYKHHTNQLPIKYSTCCTKHIQAHNYSARNAQDYITNKMKKAFSDRAYCGPIFGGTHRTRLYENY